MIKLASLNQVKAEPLLPAVSITLNLAKLSNETFLPSNKQLFTHVCEVWIGSVSIKLTVWPLKFKYSVSKTAKADLPVPPFYQLSLDY